MAGVYTSLNNNIEIGLEDAEVLTDIDRFVIRYRKGPSQEKVTIDLGEATIENMEHIELVIKQLKDFAIEHQKFTQKMHSERLRLKDICVALGTV